MVSFLTDEGERLTDEISQLAYCERCRIGSSARSCEPCRVSPTSIRSALRETVCRRARSDQASAVCISYSQLARALRSREPPLSANYIQRAGESYLVRADARITPLKTSGSVVAARAGVPVTVKQLATVRIGGELRAARAQDGYEVVIGDSLDASSGTAARSQRPWARNSTK